MKKKKHMSKVAGNCIRTRTHNTQHTTQYTPHNTHTTQHTCTCALSTSLLLSTSRLCLLCTLSRALSSGTNLFGPGALLDGWVVHFFPALLALVGGAVEEEAGDGAPILRTIEADGISENGVFLGKPRL